MTSDPVCSLIVIVYNQAPQLRLLLESAARQSMRDFEIVVADDGSADQVQEVIGRFRAGNPGIPLQHVHQEDAGFRKPAILNKAVRAARSDYLVMVDGDMILHPRFVENHVLYRNEGRVLCGYRGIKIGEKLTRELLAGRARFRTVIPALIYYRLRGWLDSPLRGLVLHNRYLRRLAVPQRGNLSGGNFSLFRRDWERVNGMDETITRYGYEDFELGHRLALAGIRSHNVSKCCNTYHLYHPKRKVGSIREIKNRILESTELQCRHGYRQLDVGSTNADFAE